MINGHQIQTSNNVIEKYCYSNDTTICKIYGGLYTWDEAMQYHTDGVNVQGICPPGWHIPDTVEFTVLSSNVNNNANSVKAIGQGAGTDASGFSALMSGYHGQAGSFYDIGDYTNYWSSAQSDSSNAHVMWLGKIVTTLNQNPTGKSSGFSVRCIKN
jgi:uncharacterized protein (TIGR02145 family)